jgi:hypothetical protein
MELFDDVELTSSHEDAADARSAVRNSDWAKTPHRRATYIQGTWQPQFRQQRATGRNHDIH